MVYFWRRQQRSVHSSLTPAISSSPVHFVHPLPPQAVVALSAPIPIGGGHVGHHNHTLHTGSTGRGGITVGHSILHNGNLNYGHLSKTHQISPVYMLDKLSEYSRRKQESDRRRVAERELDNLNMKIDKLLLKIGDSETQGHGRLRLEDECVVCLAAAATMQTFPCGHKVVCRKCLIKTIQVAVSQRCLPLRCVICRDRILTLHHTTQLHGSTYSANVLQSSPVPTALIPPILTNSRSSSVTPTSSSSLYSLINSARFQSSSPRPLSPPGASVPTLYNLTSSTSISEKLQKSPQFQLISPEEEFLRFAPTDIEAFVNSHNDALNLHKAAKPNEQKSVCKPHRYNNIVSSSEAISHSFVHCQSVKIHPTATEHPTAFMDCPRQDCTDLSPFGSKNLQQKPVGASKFLAKFLSRKSKRKCNWFRQEN